MSLSDLTVDTGVGMTYKTRDLGYGSERDCGEFVYRGREQYGKYTFENCDNGELIYLFDDEIVSLDPIERTLFRVTVDVYVKPSTHTWERFAFNERMAEREATGTAMREWPNAKLVVCSETAAVA